jgi:hypothetical protein
MSFILRPRSSNTEQARPKRQVVGESLTGDTSVAGVVQQQNAAVPRPRRRCDSVHPLHFHWERSSPAERSLDVREAERAALSAPTIFEGIAQSAERVLHMHQVEGAIPSALTISVPVV